jgi:RNA polymerase sigma-70 factor, ECF subfamily
MKTSDENVLGAIIGRKRKTASEQFDSKKKYLSKGLKEDFSYTGEAAAEQIENEVMELLRQHAPALLRYAARVARDKTIAQDAIQETFLRYFIARAEGAQIENPRAWLFRVLANYLTDCIRKSSSMPAADLEEAAQVADMRQDVEARYQQDEVFRCALASLSLRERECLQLRLEGFGYDEIAQILRIRPGTVGALLARSLKKIRKAGLLSGRQR